ncbi:MAG: DUF6249 domain-containing protein [Bacteroidales bacterium]
MLRVKFIAFTIISVLGSLCCMGQEVAAADSVSIAGGLPAQEVIKVVEHVKEPNNMKIFMDAMEDILIPITAIVIPFLVAFLIVFFVLRFQLNRKKEKYAVVMKALEMGKDLPAEFFQEKPKKQASPLESALVLIAAGLGLVVMAVFISPILYGVGALCILIGIAKFIAWKIELQKQNDTTTSCNE